MARPKKDFYNLADYERHSYLKQFLLEIDFLELSYGHKIYQLLPKEKLDDPDYKMPIRSNKDHNESTSLKAIDQKKYFKEVEKFINKGELSNETLNDLKFIFDWAKERIND